MGRVYKLSADSTEWELPPPMPRPRRGHACLVAQGFLYVFGGVLAETSVMGMNLATKIWETRPRLDTPFDYGQAIMNQDTIFLVYHSGKVVKWKVGTLKKWEDVTNL